MSVINFGCRLNAYESDVMKSILEESGVRDFHIVNTCAVTVEAERQVKQEIRKLNRERPDDKIIVTGCASHINPDIYGKLPGVIGVIDNGQKLEKRAYAHFFDQKSLKHLEDTIKKDFIPPVTSFEGKARAFIQIQNGCDHRCTFCIIPYGRGPSKSVPVGGIVDQIQHVMVSGCQEVVLTGVDITAYGLDLPGKPSFGSMIDRLLTLVPDLKRLRLSSLDPAELDEDFWSMLPKHRGRLLPHFHISLQAGHDLILKRMKRRHLRDDIMAFCERIRSYYPDAVFGADIIVGFPTETDDMFEATLDLVKRCNLTYLHVFSYSSRPGTPAARMPQVDKSKIKERSKILRQLGQEQIQSFYRSCTGLQTNVLIESMDDKGIYKGKTDHFALIRIETSDALQIAQCYPVVISEMTESGLVGRVI